MDVLSKLDELPPESLEKLSGQIKRVQAEARKLRAQARRLRRAQKVKLEKSRNSMTDNLRKQGRSLAQNASEWGDDATYQLHKQRRSLSRTFSDWGEAVAYKMRLQRKNLARKLNDRKEDAAHKLRQQGRYVARKLSDRKDDITHKLRKQGRYVVRNLSGRREDATHKLREQGQQFVDRSSQLLEPVRERGRKVLPIVGFAAGLVLAGGVTFWLVRRAFRQSAEEEERQIELSHRESLNGLNARPSGETHYVSQGGAAVVTKPNVQTDVLNKFVGVLSTHKYYPIEQKPDESDLVFFTTEDEARSEGFKEAW
jgi:hypothetical protein